MFGTSQHVETEPDMDCEDFGVICQIIENSNPEKDMSG